MTAFSYSEMTTRNVGFVTPSDQIRLKEATVFVCGTGGMGGAANGGAGGSNSVSGGTFNMSNTMNGTAQSAAGISVISQNTGISSLVQQSVNVQSNLSVGP